LEERKIKRERSCVEKEQKGIKPHGANGADKFERGDQRRSNGGDKKRELTDHEKGGREEVRNPPKSCALWGGPVGGNGGSSERKATRRAQKKKIGDKRYRKIPGKWRRKKSSGRKHITISFTTKNWYDYLKRGKRRKGGENHSPGQGEKQHF